MKTNTNSSNRESAAPPNSCATIADQLRLIKNITPVYALVDADSADLQAVIPDETMPGGGYVEQFPLGTGVTYIICAVQDAAGAAVAVVDKPGIHTLNNND